MNMLAIAVIAVVTHAPSALAESTPVPWFVRVSTYLAPTSIGPAFKLPTAPVVTITQAQTCQQFSGWLAGTKKPQFYEYTCWKGEPFSPGAYWLVPRGDSCASGDMHFSERNVAMKVEMLPSKDFGGDPCCGGSKERKLTLEKSIDPGNWNYFFTATMLFKCVPRAR